VIGDEEERGSKETNRQIEMPTKPLGKRRSFGLLILLGSIWNANSFQYGKTASLHSRALVERVHRSAFYVSVGLGPEEDIIHKQEEDSSLLDVTEPNHELFRTLRLSDFDKTCDDWFGTLVGNTDTPHFLGEVSKYAAERLHTLVELKDQVRG